MAYFRRAGRADNCADCGDGPCCEGCPASPPTTYTLTIGGFTCTVYRVSPSPIDLSTYGVLMDGCVWQWIGDASSSSAYDAGGPDCLTLSLELETYIDPIPPCRRWAVRQSLTADQFFYARDWKASVTGSPIGSYSGGWSVSA